MRNSFTWRRCGRLIVSAVLIVPGVVAYPGVDRDEMVSTAWQVPSDPLAEGAAGLGGRGRPLPVLPHRGRIARHRRVAKEGSP